MPWFKLKPREEVDFRLIGKAKVRYLGKGAKLEDIPAGTCCRFSLYQDTTGKINRASDDFSHRLSIATTLRIDALHLNDNRIDVSLLQPEVKDYNRDMQRPQPLDRSLLPVSNGTRLWKLDKRIELTGPAIGDPLQANTTAELPGKPSTGKDL